jgi:hypothetical protein
MAMGVVRTSSISAVIRCFILMFGAALAVSAQETNAQEHLPPAIANFSFSLPLGEPSASDSALPSSPASSPGIDVSWKTLPINILRDQRHVWLFPVEVAKGHHLPPMLAVVGVTAVLIEADPPSMRCLCIRKGQRLPVRTRSGGVFNRDSHGKAIREPSLGSLGCLRNSNSIQLFACAGESSFPLRCFSWSGTGLHCHEIRRLSSTLALPGCQIMLREAGASGGCYDWTHRWSGYTKLQPGKLRKSKKSRPAVAMFFD